MLRVILHLDMDAFFASVEQRDYPELRGKPVIVGGGGARGIVCTASYEARTYGVHSAMPLRMAQRLCPEGIFMPARFEAYEEASNRVMSICSDFSPVVEKMSLDEAYLDLTGTELLLGTSEKVAQQIRRRIVREVHLPVSIGVAGGKAVAKIAADTCKPMGLKIVPPGEEAGFLAPLPVRDLPGVGPRMEERLIRLGLRKIRDLSLVPRPLLTRQFGVAGNRLWDLSHGIDRQPVLPNTATRSVGMETTFDEDIDSIEVIRRWILRLADNLASRLRRRLEYARKLQLKLRLEDFTTIQRSVCLPAPTNSLSPIYRYAIYLLEKEYRPGMRFRLIGLSLSDLDLGGPIQLNLFGGRQVARVDAAMDCVRKRFGDERIVLASTMLLDGTVA